MSKELEALRYKLNEIRKTQSKPYIIEFDENYIDDLLQALTTPTADEIVKELNDISEYFWEFENGRFQPTNCTKNDGVFDIIQENELDLAGFDMLPIKLAHKITTFFMNENKV